VLGSSDVGKLIESCPVVQKQSVLVLNDVYVVSKGFLERYSQFFLGFMGE
jgi:hypothetical protein